MANIISIGTALPKFCNKQKDILQFMQQAYKLEDADARKLAFLYKQSAIETRYSVLEDFSNQVAEGDFVSTATKAPSVQRRMQLYDEFAVDLSIAAIKNCIKGIIEPKQITHLITVSCTGMSAPGLDLQVAEAINLNSNIFRTSVNFMGCYAAIHALKIAKMICATTPVANVMVVCTELCTLHFQQEFSHDNAAASLLFADGSAAALVSNNLEADNSLSLKTFYAEVATKGKEEMSWQISDNGFLMKLSSYIPQLIQEDIAALVSRALEEAEITKEDITHWCLHPGGKKILDVIQNQLSLSVEDLSCSRHVLSKYGNMSSPTILFVLKEIMNSTYATPANVFGVAFGPGLTMETFIATRN